LPSNGILFELLLVCSLLSPLDICAVLVFSHFCPLPQQVFFLGPQRQLLLMFGFEVLEDFLVRELDVAIIVAGVLD
jgi:hypothetical protein